MKLLRYPDPLAAAQACGKRILDILGIAIGDRQAATLAISGGSSPKPMFELFAWSGFPWEKIQIFWVDERCVPISDRQSNFRMANETWLAPAKVPAANIHRVLTELSPAEAARDYTEKIRALDAPFDVIHRGLGPDAHTASLFPGEPLINDRESLAAAVWVGKMHQWRVTMLPRVLEAARQTVVLATGADKASALDAVLRGPYDPMRFPAQIGARGPNVTCFTDVPADLPMETL
jgi:6-phosphogluconolactonase